MSITCYMPDATDNPPVTTVFFDLDGTLADTAPDLASALNALRAVFSLPSLPYEQIRPVVSHGGNALIQLGFGKTAGDAGFDGLRERFLNLYNERLHADSQLFTGMDKVLEALEKNHFKWGIITNKPSWLTTPLLEKMQLPSRPACVVCGDSTDFRKPHPAPMQLALKLTGSDAAASVYVGDARRDVEAAQAVSMPAVIASYGYIGKDERPEEWQADGLINTPEEILDWLHKYNHS